MSVMSFYKVDSLPTVLVPNAIYFVRNINDAYVDIYVTDNTGQGMRSTVDYEAVKHVAAKATATTLVKTVTNYETLSTLDTYATRIAFVIDASGDSTVTSGAATYIFNQSIAEWVKVAEFESMDTVLQWTNIEGKPNSTPEAIDNAVKQTHTHANKHVLDKFDVNANGTPVFKPTEETERQIMPMRYFNESGEVQGEIVAFTTTVATIKGKWTVDYSFMGFKQIIDYHCSGVFRADGTSNYSIPTIDERTVTLTSISGYATTRTGAGLLATIELTKADSGFVRVTVIGVI